MRIVGGEFGGRRLAVPRDARVRPTADRVREAWMSILADELPGARVLDLYAGSGALGLEALSRGAARADFVELSPASLDALRANLSALSAEARATVHRADALRFVERLPAGAYDIAAARVKQRQDVIPTVEAARRSGVATLIEFQVEKEDSVYPMVPAGSDLHDMIRRPSEEGVKA